MDEVVINRVKFSNKSTIGDLHLLGEQVCNSIELSCRRGDEKGLLAVPAGRYLLTIEMSPRLKILTPRLHNVPGRSGILIHPANMAEQLDGCIAPGIYDENTPDFVSSSRKHFQIIMDALLPIKKEMFITITGGGK